MSEDQPLVSVLMTAYNRSSLIGTAIESVLNSSYTNFELIIVDDCSKDDTVEVIKKYAHIDSRINFFINTKNLGDYPNRNQAAKYAKGKYLKYVDADDYIYPWGIELLVNMMELYPNVSWGLCSLPQNIAKPFPFLLSPREAYLYNYLGPGLFHKAPLSSIIKRDLFNAEGGFPENRMTSDFEMWHKLALNHSLLLMPEGIVWYREHGEQEIKSYRQYIPQYEKIKIKYIFHTRSPLNASEISSIIKKMRNENLKAILKSLLFLKANLFFDSLSRLKSMKNAKQH